MSALLLTPSAALCRSRCATHRSGGRAQAFRAVCQPRHVGYRCRARVQCYAALSNRSLLYLSGGAEINQTAQEAADALKANLRELEEERKAATTKAEKMAVKSQRLAESIENLQAGALRAMKQNDESAARELLQEKTLVTSALQKCKDRAATNFTLAEKLNKLIGAKQTELIALLHQSSNLGGLSQKPFSVDPAGMVSIDDDHPTSSDSFRQQQHQPGGSSQYRSPALDSQDYSSEEDIDNKFLELERQTLESMMQASHMDSQPTGSNTNQQRVSSGSSASSSAADSTSSSTISSGSSSDWWHRASRNLQLIQQQRPPLEAHQAQSMSKDITTLLTRLVNARVMRGMDPTPAQLVDLAVFHVAVRASEVRIAPPRTDFTINIRQRLFRDATAVALAACQLSATGRTTAAWQELAENWDTQQGQQDSATADEKLPQLAGKLAHMFLRNLAELFKLDQSEAQRIVHAAVAAHTRAKLLTAVTAVKQAEDPDKANAALTEMRDLAAVVDAFPLPAQSPEMELVHSGLRGFLGYQDRKTLHEAYLQVSGSHASKRAVADALGMNL